MPRTELEELQHRLDSLEYEDLQDRLAELQREEAAESGSLSVGGEPQASGIGAPQRIGTPGSIDRENRTGVTPDGKPFRFAEGAKLPPLPGEKSGPSLPSKLMPNMAGYLADMPKDKPIPSLKDAPGLGAAMYSDAMSMGTRLAASALGGQRMEDPEANLARPLMQKAKRGLGIDTSDPNHRPPQTMLGEVGRGAANFAIETIGGIAGDPFSYLGPVSWLAEKAAKAGNALLGRAAEELSGVTEEALRAYGTGFGKKAASIRNAAGTQKKVANKILDIVDHAYEHLPERDAIDNALENMPPIKLERTIGALRDALVDDPVGSSKTANVKIQEMIDDLAGLGESKPATAFRKIRKQLDDQIGEQFGEESGEYISALKAARSVMAEDLVDVARKTGNTDYVQAMETMAEKLQAIDDVKDIFGQSGKTRALRAQSVVDNLFGRNKTAQQEILQRFGEVFDSDFLEQSKLAHYAAQFGPSGAPGYLPRSGTGRSTMAILGAPLSGGVSLALGSPKIAAGALEVADQGAKIIPKVNGARALTFGASHGMSRGLTIPEDDDEGRKRGYSITQLGQR